MSRVINTAGGPRPASLTTTVTESPYTVQANDRILLVDDDTIGSQVTILLPTCSGNAERELSIKKIGSTASVVVDGNGSETIDRELTQTIVNQYDSMNVVCDSTQWWII